MNMGNVLYQVYTMYIGTIGPYPVCKPGALITRSLVLSDTQAVIMGWPRTRVDRQKGPWRAGTRRGRRMGYLAYRYAAYPYLVTRRQS